MLASESDVFHPDWNFEFEQNPLVMFAWEIGAADFLDAVRAYDSAELPTTTQRLTTFD